eukprot:JP436130.1.p2 GENE.JP436130.1~~JP436130.1.p2  ORF type:complete len:65 (+),score=8.92 JP436130.1:303-497(+)
MTLFAILNGGKWTTLIHTSALREATTSLDTSRFLYSEGSNYVFGHALHLFFFRLRFEASALSLQ